MVSVSVIRFLVQPTWALFSFRFLGNLDLCASTCINWSNAVCALQSTIIKHQKWKDSFVLFTKSYKRVIFSAKRLSLFLSGFYYPLWKVILTVLPSTKSVFQDKNVINWVCGQPFAVQWGDYNPWLYSGISMDSITVWMGSPHSHIFIRLASNGILPPLLTSSLIMWLDLSISCGDSSSNMLWKLLKPYLSLFLALLPASDQVCLS